MTAAIFIEGEGPMGCRELLWSSVRSHATNAVVNEQLFVCVFRSILDLVRNMVLAKLRHFDVYRKLPLDLTQPTTPGAILSIISITAIVILFTSELVSFLQVQTQSTMYIAQDDADDKLKGQCIDLFFVFNDGLLFKLSDETTRWAGICA